MAGVGLQRIQPGLLLWAGVAAVLSAAGGLLVTTSPLVAIDVAALASAAVLVARYPYGSLLVILAVRGTAPNTPLLDGVTLVAGGIAVLVAAPRLPGRRVFLPLTAFLALAILSTPFEPQSIEGVKDQWLRVPHFGWPYARNPSVPLYEWMRLAGVLAVFCLALWAIRSRRRLEVLAITIIASAAVPIGVGLKQFVTGQTVARSGLGNEFRAVVGTFSTPGPFSFYLVVVLTVALVVFLETRSLAARVALGLVLAGGVTCLMLTYTRSAWIAFAVSVLVLALMRYRRLLIVGLVVLALAVLGAPSVATKVEKRLGDLTSRSQASSGDSVTWRTGQWGKMLHYGFSSPLTGEGFGSYPRLTVERFGTSNARYPTISDYSRPYTSSRGFLAHNDYVRTFVELGVPGLVLWVLTLSGLLVGCLRAARQPAIRPIAAAGVGVALSLILIAASDNLLSAPVMLYAFALCGGVIGASAQRPRFEPAPVPALPVSPPPPLEPEADPAPEPVARPAVRGIRAQLGNWLRGRRP